jgi:sigma-B regulation protein RsbU (phosphoserine phosphatase)
MIRLPDSAQLQRLSAFSGDATAAWRLLAGLLAELHAPLASALVLRAAHAAPRLVALTSASGDIQIDAVDPFDADGTALALTDPRTLALLATTQATRIDLAASAPDAMLRQLLGADLAIAVPMRVAGNSDHVLILGTSADQPIASADLALVDLLVSCVGAYLGGALDRRGLVEEARRARVEISGLADVQRLLLPEKPSIRGLTHAIHYQPAAIAGGDYYDLMRLSHRIPDYPAEQPDVFGLMLADVSGHGAGAAMEAVQFDAILRTYRGGEGEGPAGALTYANRHFFSRKTRPHFMTAQGFLVLPNSGQAYLCNAGHLPPLRRRGDRIERLDGSRDIPIGILREHQFHNHTYDVERGDLLVFYTDGITEARNRSGVQFGVERLEAILARPELGTPDELLGCIVAEVQAHQGGVIGNDDQTLIVLELSGTAP